jgi:hypothetical protein
MAMTYHIASHNGDDDNKTTAVTTTLANEPLICHRAMAMTNNEI